MLGCHSTEPRFKGKLRVDAEFLFWRLQVAKSIARLQRSNRRVQSREREQATAPWRGMPGEIARSLTPPPSPFSYSGCTHPIDAHSRTPAPRVGAEKPDRGTLTMPGLQLVRPCDQKVGDEGIGHYCSPSAKPNTTSSSNH